MTQDKKDLLGFLLRVEKSLVRHGDFRTSRNAAREIVFDEWRRRPDVARVLAALRSESFLAAGVSEACVAWTRRYLEEINLVVGKEDPEPL